LDLASKNFLAGADDAFAYADNQRIQDLIRAPIQLYRDQLQVQTAEVLTLSKSLALLPSTLNDFPEYSTILTTRQNTLDLIDATTRQFNTANQELITIRGVGNGYQVQTRTLALPSGNLTIRGTVRTGLQMVQQVIQKDQSRESQLTTSAGQVDAEIARRTNYSGQAPDDVTVKIGETPVGLPSAQIAQMSDNDLAILQKKYATESAQLDKEMQILDAAQTDLKVEIDVAAGTLAVLNRDLSTAQDTLNLQNTTKADLDRLIAATSPSDPSYAGLILQRDQLQPKIVDTTTKVNKLNTDQKTLTARAVDLTKTLDQLNLQLNGYQTTLAGLKTQEDNLHVRLDEILKQKDAVGKSLVTEQTKFQLNQVDLFSRAQDLMTQTLKLSKDVATASIRSQTTDVDNELATLRTQIAAFKKDEASLAARLTSASSRLESVSIQATGTNLTNSANISRQNAAPSKQTPKLLGPVETDQYLESYTVYEDADTHELFYRDSNKTPSDKNTPNNPSDDAFYQWVMVSPPNSNPPRYAFKGTFTLKVLLGTTTMTHPEERSNAPRPISGARKFSR
jgi:hypothetical protein